MRKNKISFTVRYGETDQMGVVYHGNYAQYLELGRLSWLKDLDVSYKKMEETGVVLPVISLQINFKKSALYDDTLTVVTKLKKKPSVKIEFDYEIYNENDELLVTANTILAFLNKETKKPIKCPEYVLKKIDEFYDF
ncbi:acyl-CoA thioesterase [Cellulophaga omnivescoria]|uniref:acyl-CoA thioesterase n=1 Tax=Cellulophaga omnivescoria TaxID=1888890 RepID=UPI00098689D7|nr:thioesterase family protein [Cellulophaga omnivescoria]